MHLGVDPVAIPRRIGLFNFSHFFYPFEIPPTPVRAAEKPVPPAEFPPLEEGHVESVATKFLRTEGVGAVVVGIQCRVSLRHISVEEFPQPPLGLPAVVLVSYLLGQQNHILC